MSSIFTVTRDQIFSLALRKCNVLDAGSIPDYITTEILSLQLNIMIKQWMTYGLKLWKTQELVIPLTGAKVMTLGGINSVPMYDSLDTGMTSPILDKPLKLIQAFYKNNQFSPPVIIPLTSLSKNIYNSMANPDQTGIINSVMYDPKVLAGNLYLFLTPDAYTVTNCVVHLVCRMPLQDVNMASTSLDFPNEWMNALVWGLADQIAIDYGVPPSIRQEILAKAKMYQDELNNWDVEPTSTFFSLSPMNSYFDSSSSI